MAKLVEVEAAEVEAFESSQRWPRLSCLWRSVPVSGCSPFFLAQVASSCGHRLVTSVPGLCSAWCAVVAVFGPPVTSSL